VVESDITKAQTFITDLKKADKDQSQAVKTGKDLTFNRNAVQLRVEAAVDAIATRGKRAFAKEPTLRVLFENLISTTGPQTTTEDSGDEDEAAPTTPPTPPAETDSVDE